MGDGTYLFCLIWIESQEADTVRSAGKTPTTHKRRWHTPKSQQSRHCKPVKPMKRIFLSIALTCISLVVSAQLKKDGTPDMRYNSNKAAYGTGYSTPSNSTYGQSSLNVNYQSSYQRNGTTVEGSLHTKPNDTNTDNWSTSGNTNPYTNERGSRAKDYSPNAQSYGQGQTIQTGPQGGQYYQNSNGNRTYVPKRAY